MFEEFQREMMDMFNAENAPFLGDDVEHAEEMKKRYQSLTETTIFVPGDIVVWKDHFKSQSSPSPGQPAIVVAFTPGQVLSDDPSDIVDFQRPSDLKILFESKHGLMIECWVDARRFRLWEPNVSDV